MPAKPRKIPMRMCVGCREMKEKKSLVRVVRLADGGAAIDLTGKAPGRGAYVCPDRECLKKAIRSKALERALETKIEESVFEQLSAQLPEETQA